jgi:ornithine cyclodeaminase/alanine dehydrogenase-like protein (mu-crystallin family)
MREKGEILIPLLNGEIDAAHVAGELGAVVAGTLRGRSDNDEITVFCSGGTALEYMGLCELLLERGRACGIGRQLD